MAENVLCMMDHLKASGAVVSQISNHTKIVLCPMSQFQSGDISYGLLSDKLLGAGVGPASRFEGKKWQDSETAQVITNYIGYCMVKVRKERMLVLSF